MSHEESCTCTSTRLSKNIRDDCTSEGKMMFKVLLSIFSLCLAASIFIIVAMLRNPKTKSKVQLCVLYFFAILTLFGKCLNSLLIYLLSRPNCIFHWCIRKIQRLDLPLLLQLFDVYLSNDGACVPAICPRIQQNHSLSTFQWREWIGWSAAEAWYVLEICRLYTHIC